MAIAYNERVIPWSGRWPVRYLIATIAVALPIAVLEKLRPELSQTSIALIISS